MTSIDDLSALQDVEFADEPGGNHDARYVSGGTFIFDQPEEIPARWGDGEQILWAKGEALMVCGPPGVGKTTLTGQVVRGLLGLQDQVLGYTVAPAQKVLYLAMDRPRQIARSLGRHFHTTDRERVDDRLIIWPGPPPHDIAQKTDTLLELARLAGADVVVVDSLKDAAIGLSDDAVGSGYNRARQTALAGGVDIIELHHQRKETSQGGKRDKLSDVYGSTWLTSGAGSVIGLWGEAGDPVVEFTHLKPVMDSVGPFQVTHDHQRGVSTVHGEVDLVALAAAGNGITVTMAAHAIHGEGATSAQREKVRRKITRLTVDGYLTKTEIKDDRNRDVSVWRANRTRKSTDPVLEFGGDS
ncbi:AAA family ATPase [Kocuria sp. cx-455]|uniref:AAA family ATPase n=1 Tax=Kocuria sp. cx-455 TaxID=2771377 RepID=UPI003D72F5E5